MKTIDYAKALSWYVNDKKFWPTVLTMSLYTISCIFILPIFYVVPLFLGYSIAIIRNIQAEKYELPELNSTYWKDGVTLALVAIAISMVVGMLFGGAFFGGAIVSRILREVSEGLGAVVMLGLNLLGLMLQAVLSFIAPMIYFVAYAIYAKTSSVNSMFQVENYKKLWRNNEWGIVIAYAVYMAATSALSMIGFFACCIGILPAIVVSGFIMAGFIGQLDTKGIE